MGKKCMVWKYGPQRTSIVQDFLTGGPQWLLESDKRGWSCSRWIEYFGDKVHKGKNTLWDIEKTCTLKSVEMKNKSIVTVK